MRISWFLIPVIALSCASCHPAKIENAVAFNPAEAAFINAPGKTQVDAHAFIINKTGHVQPMAGQTAWLIPVTAYSRQRIAAIYGARKAILAREARQFESDPEFTKFTRQAKTNENGHVSFDNVAPGEYYVATMFAWRPEDNIFADGAAMYETVKVTGFETKPVKVILSGGITSL